MLVPQMVAMSGEAQEVWFAVGFKSHTPFPVHSAFCVRLEMRSVRSRLPAAVPLSAATLSSLWILTLWNHNPNKLFLLDSLGHRVLAQKQKSN